MNAVQRLIKTGILLAIVLILSGGNCAHATVSQGYMTRTYTELEGLPSSIVFDVTQAPDGILWVATRNGITSHDGSGLLQRIAPRDYYSEDFKFLDCDNTGKIWIASVQMRLAYYDGDTLHSVDPLITGFDPELVRANSIAVHSRSKTPTVALGTDHHGVYLYREGKGWDHLTDDRELPSNTVHDVQFLKDRLYVATNKGISIIDSNYTLHPEFIPNELLNKNVIAFGPEYKGIPDRFTSEVRRVWVYSDGEVGILENGSYFRFNKAMEYQSRSVSGTHASIIPDYAGGAIYGCEFALFHAKYDGKVEELKTRHGLLSGGTTGMLIDREFVMWIASQRGISKIPSFRFRNYNGESGLLEDEITAIVEYKPGKMFFGHNNGFTIFDGKRMYTHPFNKSRKRKIFARVLFATVGPEGNVWFTAGDLGIGVYNPRTGHVRWYHDGFDYKSRASWLLFDKDGSVLVAESSGMKRLAKGADTFKKISFTGLERRYHRFVHYYPNRDEYLIGTKFGFFRRKGQTVEHYINDLGRSPISNVYSALITSKDILYVGTGAGLYTTSGDSLKPVQLAGQSLERPVYFIVENQEGQIWFGTDNGVFMYNQKSLTHYTTTHGLAGQETNRGAATLDHNGNLWIGTATGASCYQGDYDFVERIPPPKLNIVGINVDQDHLDPKKANTIANNHRFLNYSVHAVSFLNEGNIVYRYKLRSSDTEWSTPMPLINGVIALPKLSPGSYDLTLKIKNAFGRWSEPVIAQPLEVKYPFYGSPLFLISTVVILGSVFVITYRFLLQQRYSIRLQEEVDEKTSQLELHRKQLQQLVDARTTALTDANVLLRTEVQKRISFQKALEHSHTHLESIFNTVNDAIATVDQKGTLTKVNRGWVDLFGKKTEFYIGKSLIEIAGLKEELDLALKNRTIRDKQIELKDKDGTNTILKLSMSPLKMQQLDVFEVLIVLRDVTRLAELQRAFATKDSFHDIVGRNVKMQSVYRQISDLSEALSAVLINGESGTGKELVAGALHKTSSRSKGPFIRLNCAALSETMLESELFGHVKGAFTSAFRDRTGRFESAQDGTLFLDEIGDISLSMQTKLLRVLESGEYERVGDSKTRRTNARIISATNRNLQERITQKKFRQDLYYRLNVIQIQLPPLRERKDDIPLLVTHFLEKFSEGQEGRSVTISDTAIQNLVAYQWPGNIRELRNSLERAYIVCHGKTILPEHLPEEVKKPDSPNDGDWATAGNDSPKAVLQDIRPEEMHLSAEQSDDEQKMRIGRAMEATLWNVSKASKLLKVSRNTLYRKMKQWEIERPKDEIL